MAFRRLLTGALWVSSGALAFAACNAGGGGEKKGEDPPPLADDGTRGTPLIALGEKLEAEGKCESPGAGTPPIRRISRIEYNQAVADLFGDSSRPADGFVPEEKTGVTIGFNTNIKSTVSALAAEQYLSAAESVADTVVQNIPLLTSCTGVDDTACLKDYLVARARRAWRGTLPDEEKALLLADYDAAAAELDSEAALRLGVEAILLSPRFLYTVELGAGDGPVVPLTGSEVAGRLAAALWRSVPDQALLDAADAGELDTAEGVASQARAMLDDARAEPMLADFARQWLDVESTPKLTRDNMVWPDFTPETAQSLLGETEHFFASLARTDGGRFQDLFEADYTMANGDVAAFYGLSGPTGNTYEKVALPPERRGVLTQASNLATHAHFARSSIVLRGKMVRFQLLCDPLDPPPANVDVTLKPLEGGTTERDLAKAHQDLAACSPCHTKMDPIGYGLGAFDAVGKYTPDNGEDVSGEIAPPDLTSNDDVSGPFSGPVELGKKLAESEHAQQCYLIQSLRYAMGREEVSGDACSAAEAWHRFSDSGLDLREAVVALVASDTFRYRTANHPGESCQP